MSWEETEKKIKCPCGAGEIVQVTKENDWFQTIEETPVIKCPICSKKYRITSKYCTSMHPGHGNWTVYRLVPKTLKRDRETKYKYPRIDLFELANKDFSEFLVVSYSKTNLLSAKKALQSATSCSSLNGPARGMAKSKRSYTKSCKIKDLSLAVDVALTKYDDFFGSHDQREAERIENEKIENEYQEKIEKEGIVLQF